MESHGLIRSYLWSMTYYTRDTHDTHDTVMILIHGMDHPAFRHDILILIHLYTSSYTHDTHIHTMDHPAIPAGPSAPIPQGPPRLRKSCLAASRQPRRGGPRPRRPKAPRLESRWPRGGVRSCCAVITWINFEFVLIDKSSIFIVFRKIPGVYHK